MVHQDIIRVATWGLILILSVLGAISTLSTWTTVELHDNTASDSEFEELHRHLLSRKLPFRGSWYPQNVKTKKPSGATIIINNDGGVSRFSLDTPSGMLYNVEFKKDVGCTSPWKLDVYTTDANGTLVKQGSFLSSSSSVLMLQPIHCDLTNGSPPETRAAVIFLADLNGTAYFNISDGKRWWQNVKLIPKNTPDGRSFSVAQVGDNNTPPAIVATVILEEAFKNQRLMGVY